MIGRFGLRARSSRIVSMPSYGQEDFCDDEVALLLAPESDRVLSGTGYADLVAGPFQNGSEGSANAVFVVDYEDSPHSRAQAF